MVYFPQNAVYFIILNFYVQIKLVLLIKGVLKFKYGRMKVTNNVTSSTQYGGK